MFIKNLGILFLLIVALGPVAMRAQNAAETRLSVADLLADFDELHRIVRESHPNLFRGISEIEAEKNWRRTRRQIRRPLTKMEFLNLLNPVYSQYRDGHTFLEVPLEADDYKKYAENGGLFFPFRVSEAGGKLYLTESLGALRLPAGTEIVALNGKTAAAVYRDLTAAMSGDSEANRRASVTRLFGLVYWQRFAPGSRFSLRVRRPGAARTETVEAAGITREQMEKSLFGDKPVDAYELTPEILVLEVNKMQSTEAVKKFIDDTFARIREKNYPALVIDIRRNGGGNSVVGDWVFRHLTRKRYRQSEIKEIRLSPYLSENNKFYREWTEKLKTDYPVEGDRIVQKSNAADDEGPADEMRWIYEGKVYLLTGPRTYSSGFMMAETFKCYGFGTMAGEEPGSHRNLTGELMRFKLPKSGLVGYVAAAQFYPPCYRAAKTDFLAPDVRLAQTAEDLAAGRDRALEYIKKQHPGR